MRVGWALVLAALVLMVVPSLAAAELADTAADSTNYRIGEPSWNVGSVLNNVIPNTAQTTTTSATNTVSSTTDALVTNVCNATWVSAGCEPWGDCENGTQTRKCETINLCDGSKRPTEERRPCIIQTILPVINIPNSTTANSNQQTTTANTTDETTNTTTSQTSASTNTTAVNNTVPPSQGGEPGGNPSIRINITVPDNPTRNNSAPEDGTTSGGSGGEAPSILPISSEMGVTVPNETRIYDVIEANTTAVVPVQTVEIPVRQIVVRVENRTENVEIEVTNVASLVNMSIPEPTRPVIQGEPEQRVYGYIEVNHTNITNSNVRSANITFEVQKAWLRNNSINASTVRLSRYDIIWNKLATRMVNESMDSFYYEAESPGLSIFAIVGDQMPGYTGSVCVPLDRRCTGKTLQECSMDSKEWVDIKVCDIECRSEACLNATEAAEGTQQEKGINTYLGILIGMLILIAVLAAIAAHFKSKAKQVHHEREIMGYA